MEKNNKISFYLQKRFVGCPIKQRSKWNRANQGGEPNLRSSSAWQFGNELHGPEDNQDIHRPSASRALCHFAGFRSNASRGSVWGFCSVDYDWDEVGWLNAGMLGYRGTGMFWCWISVVEWWRTAGSCWRSSYCCCWEVGGYGCDDALRWLNARLQRARDTHVGGKSGLDWIW